MRAIIGLIALTCLAYTAAAHDTSGARHWEIASPDPDRVFLTFHGDPATSRAVTWRTDESVEQAYAEIAPASPGSGFSDRAKRHEAKTQPLTLEKDSKANNRTTHYHSVVFDELEPDTLYAYRVGSGGRWSAWIQFRTASDKAEPFRFLYFGDAQNDVHSKWSRVIRMAHRTAPDASFAIHAGDLVNAAHADREWAEWMTAGGHLHAETTGVPVTGNHEYKGKLAMQWRPQFALPVEDSLPEQLHETVYSFAYQGVQVIVLNSIAKIEEQTAYLEQKLGEGDYRWRVVTFHHPVFAPSRGPKQSKTRDHWKPILDKMDVDLVLQGHDHTYARGQTPKLSVDGEPGEALGTMYVTSVSGPKMYGINREGLDAFEEQFGLVTTKTGKNTQFFQVIDVNDGRLEYRAYTATGSLYDAVAIEKDQQGNKKLIEIPADE
ncbi:MAG: fibronectin type III domain-containing protein [Phycisphaeraceae bacterium]|nr:fibronectin type III domain-containing protein [Phycisphaeraceae bacterium]